jgi:hypothetical protein
MNRLARGGITAATLGLGSVLLGNHPASAAAPIYIGSAVTVKVTGSDASALNHCLDDARDGVINTQLNACRQVATAGHAIRLRNVDIRVFGGSARRMPTTVSHVRVVISGGPAAAISSVVNDAQDGTVTVQTNTCVQVATAGNLLQISGVAVAIYR